jgi:predicted N-formylglutamate amidohydrolase
MSESSIPAVVITCEHGGNVIPSKWNSLFEGADDVLATHRGYDPGALELANRFARELQAPIVSSTVSRLLVELNRSPDHPQLFSEFTGRLDETAREELLKGYYEPYRAQVRKFMERGIAEAGCVVHLSVHSFTPVWDGVVREVDVGLLYDPERPGEKQFCDAWNEALSTYDDDLRVRHNAPYEGTSDGLTTLLRTVYPADLYLGIELEVNQRFPLTEKPKWPALQSACIETFLAALQ